MAYSAAVIGVGGMGSAHCRELVQTSEIELVAMADVDPVILEEMGAQWNVPPERRYSSHEAMLRAEDPHCVTVASPTVFHADHVLDAVRLAEPAVIFCEKPIATSVADGDSMVRACADNDVQLLINHSRRWIDSYQTLASLVGEDQILGDVRSVTATWKNELLRNGTHLVDLLLSIMPGDAVLASGHQTAAGEFDDAIADDLDDGAAGGYVVFDDGAFMSIDLTLPRSIHTRTVTLVGTDGWMHIALQTGEWRYWERTDDGHTERTLDDIADGWSDRGHALSHAYTNVVGLLDGHADNRSPGTEAVDTLSVLVGLAISSETASHVALPLVRPLRQVRVRTW